MSLNNKIITQYQLWCENATRDSEVVEELKDTGSPEVMQVIKKYSKKISEM